MKAVAALVAAAAAAYQEGHREFSSFFLLFID